MIRIAITLFISCCALSGCAAHVVQVNIINHEKTAVKNVEVTFGGGSCGVYSLAPGATYSNRIKIFSTAALQIQFDDASGKHQTVIGPQLKKNDSGQVEVSVEPEKTTSGPLIQR